MIKLDVSLASRIATLLGIEAARPVWVGAIVAVLITLVACGDRAPALRHDWTWFPFSARAEEVFWFASGGWRAEGIGSAAPYVPWFLPGWCFAVLRLCLSPDIVATLGFASVGVMAYAAGVTVARNAQASATLSALCGLSVVVTPWLYDQLVAGHLFMIFAVAGLAAYISALNQRESTRLRWLVLASFQLQFFLPALFIAVIAGLRRSRFRPDLVIAVTLALPNVIGFIDGYRGVASTALTLPWELDQSVSPSWAWLARGYFAVYDSRLSIWASSGTVLLIALALWTLAKNRCARSNRALAIYGFVTVFAMGLRGPLSLVFALGFNLFAPLGLYRELFDVLGLAQYALIGAVAWGNLRIASVGFALGPAVVVAGTLWASAPPRSLWVPAGALPHVEPATAGNVGGRFAVLPPFQPLMWNGRGSGTDPDAMPHGNTLSPLNLYIPTYPVDVALARLAAGDQKLALRLGVASVQNRPWLQPQPIGQAGQTVANSAVTGISHLTSLTDPVPLLGQGEQPRRETVGMALHGGILVSDSTSAFPEQSLHRRSVDLDWLHNWIDVALVERGFPEFGSSFGGLATRGRTPLTLQAGSTRSVLLAVHGTLREEHVGARFQNITRLRWVRFRSDDGAMRWVCEGTCVVAATSSADLSGFPAEAAESTRRPLSNTPPAPWLYSVQTMRNAGAVLYFNVAYDNYWVAISNRVLPHWRIDGVTNAWLLGDAAGRPVILLQVDAALQFLGEIFAAVILAGVAAWSVLAKRRQSP